MGQAALRSSSGLRRLEDFLWELPVGYREGMRVPARIYASREMLEQMDAAVFEQISNVATLPGAVDYVLCMPDGHSGYGFPIGGVAAIDSRTGVISPGGIGFDINCGMRLLATNLSFEEVKPRLEALVDLLYERVPAGVGSAGLLRLSESPFAELLAKGARWCLERGYAWKEDLEVTEDGGYAEGADVEQVSITAMERGLRQVGTLGSGNHFLEIQVLRPEGIFDERRAHGFGLNIPNQVVVMFHCGSRGFGHQVATDYLRLFLQVMGKRYGLSVPDRQLACAPFGSPEGQSYFAAMKCAINMSFANRQMIAHRIREVFSEIFHRSPEDLGMHQVYDVAHNTAKLESHGAASRRRQLLIHRKGATRAFGPGMEGVPGRYLAYGQPVIIGGSMETGSYLLAGLPTGEQSFFSTAHGSGRTMSRTSAKKSYSGRRLSDEMRARGIYVRSVSWSGLAEEAGAAYKDIDEVVAVTESAGISKIVARLTPIGNVKG